MNVLNVDNKCSNFCILKIVFQIQKRVYLFGLIPVYEGIEELQLIICDLAYIMVPQVQNRYNA